MNLRSLPLHHQVLYALIHAAGVGGIRARDLHARYDEVAERIYEGRSRTPIVRRIRRDRLSKLCDYGLIEIEGHDQKRRYIVADLDVTPLIEVAVGEEQSV